MGMPRHLFVMDFEASCDTGDITIVAIDFESRILIPNHRLCTGDEVKYFKTSRDARDGIPMTVAGAELQDETSFFVRALDTNNVMLFHTKGDAETNTTSVLIDKGTGVRTCLRDVSDIRTIKSVDSPNRISIPNHRLCSGAEVNCMSDRGSPLKKCGIELKQGTACFARALDDNSIRLFTTLKSARDGSEKDALEFDAGSGVGSSLKVRPGVHWTNEIIEFPGVLVDTSTMQCMAEFRSFVRPVENPLLPAFTTKLTSITQADVDTAETLDQVLHRLDAWLREHDAEDALPVTCGDWDLGIMLAQECKRKGLEGLVPRALHRWCNVKRTYQQTLGVSRAPGMEGMLHELKLSLDGHHHLGIDDSRNIAKIAQELVKRGGCIEATAHKEFRGVAKPKESEEETARKRADRQARKQSANSVRGAVASASLPAAASASELSANVFIEPGSLSLSYLKHIGLLHY